jgi:colanic acid biosynthesis glycosyl transferase WcaI
VMGDRFPGIIHPCKVYNIISVGAPLLYIGPKESHIMDIADQSSNGYQIYKARHGETQKVAAAILTAASEQKHRPQMAHETSDLARRFSREALLPRMIQLLETDHNGRERNNY